MESQFQQNEIETTESTQEQQAQTPYVPSAVIAAYYENIQKKVALCTVNGVEGIMPSP